MIPYKSVGEKIRIKGSHKIYLTNHIGNDEQAASQIQKIKTQEFPSNSFINFYFVCHNYSTPKMKILQLLKDFKTQKIGIIFPCTQKKKNFFLTDFEFEQLLE